MRIALIQSEPGTDAAALAMARALRARGHDAVFVTPQTSAQPATPARAPHWQAEGFPWIPVSAARLTPARENFPRDHGFAAARTLAGLIGVFDAAWFFESHWAMPALRERRFRDRALPVMVLDARPDPEPIPDSLDQVNRAGARDYALRWADAILSSEDPRDGITRLEAIWHDQRNAPPRPVPRPASSPAVTVCVPYFEAHEFLPATLASLERQTSTDFRVIVVDDGSYSAPARETFEVCANRYASRGWKFLRQTNGFPGAARNRAAREAGTEFLLFLDADDIAMPQMIERFLSAALLSGDDCLVAPNYGFRDDPEGDCAHLYDPPGSLIGSMGDDMHGGACIFVRREALRAVGGFTEIRGTGFEDYEFHVRCHLHGLRWDVLPELIYRYRMPKPGSVSRSTERYANQARVLRVYEERLRGSGLSGLPMAVASCYRRLEDATDRAAALGASLARRSAQPMQPYRELRLLLITCYFPFGMMSGMHRRMQEIVRYFGSRHRLTLMTVMKREQLVAARRDAFRWLEAIRGVEGSGHPALPLADLPSRVKRHYTDNFQSALRSLPTDEYHATLIDSIFMAESRRQIDSPVVLTEHNIESRLLGQVAERLRDDSLPEEWRNAEVEAARLAHYEENVWPEFPVRAVVSEADRAYMDAHARPGKTVVAANGADLSAWLPRARRETATALFPAHLGYPPNIDAAEFLLARIWPKVRNRDARARLILAGAEPGAGIRSATASAGVELRANPPSMDLVARRASLTVVPVRIGAGTRCKILESMAWGLPVVSTTLGAEGIDAVDGEHLLIRDDPDDFAEAVLQLISDETLWRKLRKAGRALVRERYSWNRVFDPLEAALLELVS